VVFLHPVGWLGLHYYWNQVSQTPVPFGAMFPRTFDYPRLLAGGPIAPDEEWIRTSTGSCARIWLILSQDDRTISAELRRSVGLYYPSLELQNEFRGIKVILYKNRSGLPGAVQERNSQMGMLPERPDSKDAGSAPRLADGER
jgi:hypothetical protein